MSTEEYRGPRLGDLVEVAVFGKVLEMQARDGVAGVLVELPGGGQEWAPLRDTVLISRRGE